MAAKLNHTQALEHVAFAYILGDYLPQDTEKAKLMFQDLAARGSPKGQLVSILRERVNLSYFAALKQSFDLWVLLRLKTVLSSALLLGWVQDRSCY